MARCGCSGTTVCSCILQAGDNVEITGNGSVGSPYVISANDNLFVVSDTPTVDLTLTPGSPDTLQAAVKLDPAGGNLITATANGLRLDCATLSATCGIVAITVLDSTSIDFTIAGGQITGGVIIDPVGGNLLTNPGTGLRVVCSGVRGCLSAGNGITYNSGTGAISAKLSTDLNNQIIFGSDNGLYVPGGNAQGTAIQQIFTSSGTWNKPVGLKGIIVELQGGGGGSGGCALTTANQTSGSGGGKGGAYARFYLDAAALSVSHPVVVGTGGAGGASGANNGSPGVASSFDAFGSVPGGAGGDGGAAAAISGASTTQAGGASAQAFTGTATGVLFIQGDDGGTGFRVSLAQAAIPGYGGRSHLGRQQKIAAISGGASPGAVGSPFGGGAAGPSNSLAAGQAAQPGSAGSIGIVVITEIY